jgi:opacity protein-like surface antigen
MRVLTTLAAAALIALPSLAHAEWYAGADGGVNFLQDSDLTSSDGYSGKGASKTGYVLQAEGGYSFGGPRVEGEIAYRNSGIKSLTNSDGTMSGHTSALSFMTNGIYQFLPKQAWHPFVGAGIGIARIGIDWQDRNSTVSDTDWVFAYQGMAGVAYDINKTWEVKAQYRYFATEDPKFSSDNTTVTGEYSSHALMAGLTYKFGK